VYDSVSGQLSGLHKNGARGLAVLDCTFMQDSTKCVSAGLERIVMAYDIAAGQPIPLGQHDEAVRCVEFHQMSQQVISASWDRSLRCWDIRRPGVPTQVIPLGCKAFSMDTCDDKIIVGGSDRYVHIFDPRLLGSGAPLLEKRESMLRHQIRAVKVSYDMKYYASSSVEGRVAIEYFDQQENLQKRYAFKCHRVKEASGAETVLPVNTLAFHPGYDTFATGGSDGGVCIWDGTAKKRTWRLNPFETSVSSLDFSSDGGTMAIGMSYTHDQGEKANVPGPQVVVRPMSKEEVMPKQ
jgi:cell cycle arrest protein BUB3